jgi:ATP-dependent exoDNAse (exonuclease V) beta subunit
MPLDLYKASAGAGKTHTITQTYLKLLTQCRPQNILAVTFTNKATQEMKERIVETLYKIANNLADKNSNQANLSAQDAQEKLAALLHDFSHFNVSTIDGFYQQVMRSFVRELGLNGSYNLVLDPKEVIQASIDDLILSLEKEENQHLYQWLLDRAKENIQEGKDWQFKKELSKLATQLFDEQAADAIRQIEETPDCLATIKTLKEEQKQNQNALLKELKEHAKKVCTCWQNTGIDEKEAKNGTISQCQKACQTKTWPEFGSTLQKAQTDALQLVASTKLKTHKQWEDAIQQSGIQTALENLLTYWEENQTAYYSSSAILKKLDLIPVLLELNHCITNHLRKNNMVLLPHVNRFLRQMISDCDTPFIYEKLGYYIRHYMLDEFQDTSSLQWENFKPLITNSLGDGYNNMIVGDIKQSIYRWRNSNWRILAGIQSDLGSSHTVSDKSETVKTNWRSYKNIVQFNNAFFQKAPALFTEIKDGELIAQLYSDVEQAVAPKFENTTGLVNISWINKDISKDKEEVANAIKQRTIQIIQEVQQKGFDYKDIAILVNTNTQGNEAVQWLMEAQIPVVSSEALLLNQSPVIRLLLAIIRMSCSFQPEVDRYKLQVLGELEEHEYEQLCEAMRLPLFEAVEQYIMLLALNQEEQNSAYIQAFQDVVSNFANQNSADATSFIQWWDTNGNSQKLPANDQLDAIQICTIHKSKGLAYPIVIMPFCNDSIWSTSAYKMPTLWVSTDNTPYNQLPVLPMLWNKDMRNSAFAKDYHIEELYQTIDFINQWYVAFTRPKYALYLIGQEIDEEKKSKSQSNNLPSTGYAFLWQMAKSLNLPIEAGEIDDPFFYSKIGELPEKPQDKAPIEPKEKEEEPAGTSTGSVTASSEQPKPILVNGLPYHAFTAYCSKRETTKQQHEGNTLHQILQFMVTSADAEKAIAKATRLGMLTTDEVPWAQEQIAKLLAHPGTKTWFDGTYPTVWNERSILTNPYTHDTDENETGKYRPDRLLVKDQHIVVVDYKFGKESNKYIAQMQRYMESLRDMGKWDKIEGFLYYHESGSILPVSI